MTDAGAATDDWRIAPMARVIPVMADTLDRNVLVDSLIMLRALVADADAIRANELCHSIRADALDVAEALLPIARTNAPGVTTADVISRPVALKIAVTADTDDSSARKYAFCVSAVAGAVAVPVRIAPIDRAKAAGATTADVTSLDMLRVRADGAATLDAINRPMLRRIVAGATTLDANSLAELRVRAAGAATLEAIIRSVLRARAAGTATVDVTDLLITRTNPVTADTDEAKSLKYVFCVVAVVGAATIADTALAIDLAKAVGTATTDVINRDTPRADAVVVVAVAKADLVYSVLPAALLNDLDVPKGRCPKGNDPNTYLARSSNSRVIVGIGLNQRVNRRLAC